jgi:hypothetical protein
MEVQASEIPLTDWSARLTKFTHCFIRKIRLTSVILLIAGTSLFFIPNAKAAIGSTTVICSNGTNERSYQISWDNSNQFFADKGYIPAFYCTGGYAGSYRIYISDTLNGGALGYYNGVVTSSDPTPSQPSPSPSPSPSESATVDTATSTSPVDTPTPTSSPEPQASPSAPSDTQTATVDTATSASNTETSTQTTESTTTTALDTPSVSSVDGSTATSQPEPVVSVPPVVPVVIPDPVEEPVVVPEEVEPTPEPEPTEEPEAPVKEEPEDIEEEVAVPEEEPEEEEILEEEETVTLDNGVVLTQEQAVAIALLQNPAALLQELFTDPAAALAALGQVGADMSPEVREDSEKVIISAIIAGNIATQAAASAGALAALRRKP